MKNSKYIIWGAVGLIVLLIFIWAISVSNSYNKKLISGQAAQQNSEIVFDQTWKTIKGEAKVTEEYKQSFHDIYVDLMDARYKNDAGAGQQTLMKWVQESNPNFDASLYAKLMNTIEGSRENFTIEQKKLIDVDRELKSMKATWPNSWVLSGKPDLNIKIVTSGKTKEAFSTGEENDADPFDRDSTKR